MKRTIPILASATFATALLFARHGTAQPPTPAPPTAPRAENPTIEFFAQPAEPPRAEPRLPGAPGAPVGVPPGAVIRGGGGAVISVPGRVPGNAGNNFGGGGFGGGGQGNYFGGAGTGGGGFGFSTGGGMSPGFGFGDGRDDPEMAKLTQSEHELARKSQEMLGQFSSAEDDSSRQKLMTELRETLDKQFDLQIQRRELELKRVEERLAKLRDQLKKRADARKQIVDRRLEQLTSDAEGLGWTSPAGGGGSLEPFFAPAAGGTFNVPAVPPIGPAPRPAPARNR